MNSKYLITLLQRLYTISPSIVLTMHFGILVVNLSHKRIRIALLDLLVFLLNKLLQK